MSLLPSLHGGVLGPLLYSCWHAGTQGFQEKEGFFLPLERKWWVLDVFLPKCNSGMHAMSMGYGWWNRTEVCIPAFINECEPPVFIWVQIKENKPKGPVAIQRCLNCFWPGLTCTVNTAHVQASVVDYTTKALWGGRQELCPREIAYRFGVESHLSIFWLGELLFTLQNPALMNPLLWNTDVSQQAGFSLRASTPSVPSA